MSAQDYRGGAGSYQEQRAAQALARGTDSKRSHRYLSLRVYWTQGSEKRSAVLCREHRNKMSKRFPNMWDSSEWLPADSCEVCSRAKRSKDWHD